MRGRYEVSGLPLHPLVSPGGKLTFLKSRNAVRLTCPTSLFCTLCMLHVFKHRITFSLSGHVCCGLVVFFSLQNKK